MPGKLLSLPPSPTQSICVDFFYFFSAEAGICVRGERWEFAHCKFPQSQEKQEDGESCRLGAVARAGWPSQLFEHEAPVGFPHINARCTPTLLPPLNSLTLP